MCTLLHSCDDGCFMNHFWVRSASGSFLSKDLKPNLNVLLTFWQDPRIRQDDIRVNSFIRKRGLMKAGIIVHTSVRPSVCSFISKPCRMRQRTIFRLKTQGDRYWINLIIPSHIKLLNNRVDMPRWYSALDNCFHLYIAYVSHCELRIVKFPFTYCNLLFAVADCVFLNVNSLLPVALCLLLIDHSHLLVKCIQADIQYTKRNWEWTIINMYF